MRKKLLDESDGGYRQFDDGKASSSHGHGHDHSVELGKEAFDYDENGLTEAEAQRRYEKYGPNAIEEKVVPTWIKVFNYYINGPMQYMILFAAILSGAIQHYDDLAIMLILLLLNGTLSFYESQKAGDAVAALKNSLAPKCRVYRDGVLRELESKCLVPGDKIVIKLGDIVPADGRLLDGEPLTVDESALTGESLPVTKYPGSEVLAGGVVKIGEIDCIVTKTGVDSFLGKSAALVASVQSVGHFQKVLFNIAMTLVVIAITLVVIILGVQLHRGESVADVLQLCVVVLIASIPIALPVVSTGTMAVGARRLARCNAIVSRLASIEELSGMTILCSDKTGTLTKNKLTVEEPYVLDGVDTADLFFAGALASKREQADAIDTAVCSKIPNLASLDVYRVEKFIPFDPVSKRTQAHIRDPNGNFFKVSKGAPQVLFKLDGQEQPQAVQDQVNRWVEALAARGLRPLGVAKTDAEGNWEYLGLISLFDPPRDDTRDTIEKALEMGVDVKMVTGDHLLIAKETARKLGMGTNMYGTEFFEQIKTMPDSQIQDIAVNADGFAQVYPEHKYFIVEAIQKSGRVTGMTGDGVNDAPALKRADVGIAVEGATDAARAAADIVLVTPGLSVIITAMIRSRKIFRRLLNYVIYRLSATTQILVFVFIAVIFLTEFDDRTAFEVPAIVLVLITIINDGTIMTIAYDKVIPSNQPEVWDMLRTVIIGVVIGGLGVLEAYIIFMSAKSRTFIYNDTDFPNVPCPDTTCSNTQKLRAVIWMSLSIGGQFSVYAARTKSFFFSRRPGFVLLTMSCCAQLINFFFAKFWFLSNGVEGVSWSVVFKTLGYLCMTFIIKDIVKVFVYYMIEKNPGRVDETMVRRQTYRKIQAYGTADEEQIVKQKSLRASRRQTKHMWETEDEDD